MQFDARQVRRQREGGESLQAHDVGPSWAADYPDGDNFMQLLYGPNIGQSNNGCYESKAFDAFYEKARDLPDSPERRRLYLEMSRQMEVDGAWRIDLSRLRNQLIRPWVRGYKSHPILHAVWQYIDIAPKAALGAGQPSNGPPS